MLGAVRPEGGALSVTPCTPNEPALLLDAAGCNEANVLMHTKPIQPDVHARVRASNWLTCCALCNQARECQAWSHDQDRPAGVINCWLMRGFKSVRHSQGQGVARKRLPQPGEPPRMLATYEVPDTGATTARELASG